MILKCPHCRSRMTSRTAREMSPLSVESYQHCTNFECGFRCKVLAEIVAELKPAELRNPAIVLPVVHPRAADMAPLYTSIRPFHAVDRERAKRMANETE